MSDGTKERGLRFGYGTNGLADLRLDDALGLLADLGYHGVGLTLDHMHLDPLAPAPELAARTRHLARRLDRLGLDIAIETGARYVLDPRRKHHPTLLDPDLSTRALRAGLLLTAVRIAAELGASAVHCFSGRTPPGMGEEEAWRRLAEAVVPVLDAAHAAGVPLAVEPEPGHLLSDLAGFHRLRTALGDPEGLGLTLDIGHCQCLEPEPPADCVRAAAPWLRHVQIEDMRRGVHEHLPFGDGEIDFPPVLSALRAAGYDGLVSVELPRDSHAGPQLAAFSLSFLRAAERAARQGSRPGGAAAPVKADVAKAPVAKGSEPGGPAPRRPSGSSAGPRTDWHSPADGLSSAASAPGEATAGHQRPSTPGGTPW